MRELIYEQIHQILENQNLKNMRYNTVPDVLERMLNKSFIASKTFNRNKGSYKVTEEKLASLDDWKLLDFYTYVVYRRHMQM